MKAFTKEEIRKHNKEEDCWMILGDRVFDITSYIKFHPGGRIILDAAGKDGTGFFSIK